MQLPDLRIHWARNMIGGGSRRAISASALLLNCVRPSATITKSTISICSRVAVGPMEQTAINGPAKSSKDTIPSSRQPYGMQFRANSTFWRTMFSRWAPRPIIQMAAPPTRTSVRANSIRPIPPWYGQPRSNTFQRFNFVAKYYVDPSVVKQMGFVGNITLKGRYTFERNRCRQLGDQQFHPVFPVGE